MTGAQWAAAVLAGLVVVGYLCRMGAFEPRRDAALMGLAHYVGFVASSWVLSEALQHPLGPAHGVALLGAALWLGASFPAAVDAPPSGWAPARRD